MSNRKERLTVTVDPELIQAGQEAVSAGPATSLSAWVSAALAEHVLRERRLSTLAEAVADYEAEFGEITDREMREQARADRAASLPAFVGIYWRFSTASFSRNFCSASSM